jgi:Flp pilus assembly protein TadD
MDPYPLFSLAMVCLREGKAAEAEAYALKALKLDAKSAYTYDVLGLAYANQGKIALALASLNHAIILAPKEKFIRKHYKQVRVLQNERTRLKNINEKEELNEKTKPN